MLFLGYKYRHIEHNNTMHTLFQISLVRLTLIDEATKWRSVKSLWHKLLWCTISCLKFAFHTCTPGNVRPPGSSRVFRWPTRLFIREKTECFVNDGTWYLPSWESIARLLAWCLNHNIRSTFYLHHNCNVNESIINM